MHLQFLLSSITLIGYITVCNILLIFHILWKIYYLYITNSASCAPYKPSRLAIAVLVGVIGIARLTHV